MNTKKERKKKKETVKSRIYPFTDEEDFEETSLQQSLNQLTILFLYPRLKSVCVFPVDENSLPNSISMCHP